MANYRSIGPMKAGELLHLEQRKCSAALPSPIGQFSRLNLAITGVIR